MRNRLVIAHGPSCFDGFTAAWIARKKFGDNIDVVFAKYDDPVPDVTGRDVLILDFSYPRAVLVDMHSKAASLRVLDHHKTAEADLAGLEFCTFDMCRSGAGLAWDHLFVGRPRPPLVDLVEDRDLWRFALPDSRELNAWIGSHEQNFEIWDAVAEQLEKSRSSCFAQGAAILRCEERRAVDMAKEAETRVVDGYDVPVVNVPYSYASSVAGKLAESAPFAVGWFRRRDRMYQYSLRSRGDVDVSIIAEKFGGGGHSQAAGFTAAAPPDVLFSQAEKT